MVNMSQSALAQLKNIKKSENRPDSHFLRVEVKKGGCSGLSYKMDFDHQIREGDQEFTFDSEKMVVDSESLLYILGMELDYQGGLNGKGFIFNNPTATKACGCGASFNV